MTGKTKSKKRKKQLAIASRKCAGCSYCKLNCPADAMVVEQAMAHPTEGCTMCGTCVWVCPVGAISME